MGAETNHIVDWSAIERCRFDDEIVRVHFAQAQIIEQFGPFSTASESSREYEIEQFIQPAFRQPFQTGQFSSKKHDLGFALMNQLASAHKRFPTSEQDIAADFFALRKSYEATGPPSAKAEPSQSRQSLRHRLGRRSHHARPPRKQVLRRRHCNMRLFFGQLQDLVLRRKPQALPSTEEYPT